MWGLPKNTMGGYTSVFEGAGEEYDLSAHCVLVIFLGLLNLFLFFKTLFEGGMLSWTVVYCFPILSLDGNNAGYFVRQNIF